MYKQRNKWAWSSVIVTIITTVLLLGLGLYFLITDLGSTCFPYIILGSLAIICLCSLFFFPLEVRINEKSVSVVFPMRIKEIPVMRNSRVEPYKVTMNFVRTFGSGAFFGWWGWFRNQELGKFMVYAANLDNVFLIETCNGKKYVISCNDPEAMCSEIKNVMNHI